MISREVGVDIFAILVVLFFLRRVASLMIHPPPAISTLVCVSLPPLPLRAAFDFTAGYDRARLEPRRFSVEDERGLYSRGDEIRGPIDDPGQMRRHAALVGHQGRSARFADDGDELIQRV